LIEKFPTVWEKCQKTPGVFFDSYCTCTYRGRCKRQTPSEPDHVIPTNLQHQEQQQQQRRQQRPHQTEQQLYRNQRRRQRQQETTSFSFDNPVYGHIPETENRNNEVYQLATFPPPRYDDDPLGVHPCQAGVGSSPAAGDKEFVYYRSNDPWAD